MATVKVSTTVNCNRAINYADKRAEVKEGVNCDVDNAKEEMNGVREMYAKTEGIQAHLVIQSFSPAESQRLGPESVNQLGIEFAERIAPGHQVAVYTHADKQHLHNHLVINSVNLETGYKYQAHGTKALDFFRQQNDAVALEHGLDVLHETALERRTMAEIKLEEKGVPTWKQEIRQAIDSTMQDLSVTSYDRFREVLTKKGVNVYDRGKNVTYELLEGNKKVRGSKLGDDYQKETIATELDRRSSLFQETHKRPAEHAQAIETDTGTTMTEEAQRIRSAAIKEAAEKERKQQKIEKETQTKQIEQQKQASLQQRNGNKLDKGMEFGR